MLYRLLSTFSQKVAALGASGRMAPTPTIATAWSVESMWDLLSPKEYIQAKMAGC
jgi:hypothetical protein